MRRKKTKKPISNFRRGVNFEQRTKRHFIEKKDYTFAKREYRSLGPADVWAYKPVVITKEMIGQTLTKLALIQCKTNKYYFNAEQRQNLLDLAMVTGGEPLLVYRTKKFGPLIIEKVVPI